MKGCINAYSPISYFVGGIIGFFIFWFYTGLTYSQDMNLISSLLSGLLSGLIFGALPIWLIGLIKYLFYKPLLVISVFNTHLEGKFKRISNKKKLKEKIKQLEFSLNPEKVDFHYYHEDHKIKIDFYGEITYRTEIFTKLMNFFKTEITF